MKVKCLYNLNSGLHSHFVTDYQIEQLNLEVNKEYVVYGMFVSEDICEYLLLDKYNKLFLFTDEIFEVIDNTISSIWYFNKYKTFEGIDLYVYGYYELVNYENYMGDLQERVQEALEIFEIRKIKMDMEYSEE